MSSSVSSASSFQAAPATRIGQAVMAALAVWLGAVAVLGAGGAFVGAPGKPPLPVFAGAVVPVLLFAVAWRTSQVFRGFLLALDARLLVAIQAGAMPASASSRCMHITYCLDCSPGPPASATWRSASPRRGGSSG